jgi:hypothetical protein
MYPQRELTRLADRKAALRRRISLRRLHCAEAASRVLRPLDLLDRILALLRQLAPLARDSALPLGIVLLRVAFPKLKTARAFLRWSPLLLDVLRSAWASPTRFTPYRRARRTSTLPSRL